jgi:curved DNA-binding protein CbpA
MIKKIEDMDFYEILNLRLDATQTEIENAYLLAMATYREEAMASYGVLTVRERELMLDRTDEAFRTLADPKKRRAYDAAIVASRPESKRRAYFRNSTEKLEIEDAEEKEKLWDRFKSAILLRGPGKKKNSSNGRKNIKNWEALQRDRYYYGEILRSVREQRGMTLEEAAQNCNVSASLLKALENEDDGALPNEKVRAKLLRAYAGCLGLNPENGRK